MITIEDHGFSEGDAVRIVAHRKAPPRRARKIRPSPPSNVPSGTVFYVRTVTTDGFQIVSEACVCAATPRLVTDEERDAALARIRADRLARGGAPVVDPDAVQRCVAAEIALATKCGRCGR